jgi:hypothetical protein
MKKKQGIFFGFAVLMIAVMITVAGCGSANGGPTGGNPDPVSVTGVSLNKPALTLAVEGTETLTATVSPANATNKAVTWSSSDTETATVDTDGLVTLVKAGSATITATTTDGGFTATCTVTDPRVTGVTLNKAALTLEVGENETLTATVSPDNATNKAVTWSSSDTETATVDTDGLVTLKKVGKATITVITVDGSFFASCTVADPETVSITGINAADFGAEITPTYKTIDISEGYEALDNYLTSIAHTAGNYAVTVTGEGHRIAFINDHSFSLTSGVTISLRGDGTLVKHNGYMWQVQSGAKLILRGPTLDGNQKNRPLVSISSGGEFVMEDGIITGSYNTGGYGGGVYNNGGTFTMNGGTITNNKTNGGGGGVYNNGTFTMNGGSITNNTAPGSGGGGGVCIGNGGTFNLNTPIGKASISGNILSGSGSGAQVYFYGAGIFKVNGNPETSYD